MLTCATWSGRQKLRMLASSTFVPDTSPEVMSNEKSVLFLPNRPTLSRCRRFAEMAHLRPSSHRRALLAAAGFAWPPGSDDPFNPSQAAIERFWQVYHGNDYSEIPQVEEQRLQAI
jgi:hypothetical protein